MRPLIVFFTLLGILAGPIAATAATVSPAAMDRYREARASFEEMRQAKAGVYARDVLEAAQQTLAKAREAADSGNEGAMKTALDMAVLQMDLAKARTEEREAAEKTAVTRARLDKLQKRLDDILAGKGDKP
jgi:hypothetical protein